jgi:hypothetical protein
MAVSIFICINLLDIPSATAGRVPAWVIFVFPFSIGFAGGFVAPHLYRSRRSEQPLPLMVPAHQALG